MADSVTIIGSGVVGMATASYLRLEGRDVTVVDERAPGEYCSFGNAGILSPASCVPLGTPGILARVPRYLVDPLSPLAINPLHALRALPWFVRFVSASRQSRVDEIATSLRSLLKHTFDAWIPLAAWAGVPELIRRDGYIVVYETPQAYEGDAPAWKIRRDRGVEFVELDHDELRNLEPALRVRYERAILVRDQGYVRNPIRLTQALARQFEKDGGRILRRRVIAVETANDNAKALVTDAGRLPVETLVVCAGVHSNELTRNLDGPVPLESQRGYHVQFDESPESTLTRPLCSAEGKFFMTPMEHGIRVAGSVEFSGTKTDPDYARANVLKQQAERILPSLASGRFTTWAGHRPCMPDSLPVIGRSPRFRNTYYGFGHGHVGLCSAAPTGRIIADLIAGRPPALDIAPFRINRFTRAWSRAAN